MSLIEIIRPGETLRSDPVDASFAHGFGLFETMRVEAGVLYFWEAHWSRLCDSARTLGLPVPVGADAVLAAIRELVADVDPDGESTLKVSLLREGSGARLIVYTRPTSPRPDRVGLLSDDICPLNERSLLAGHKTHNYMENRLLIDNAQAQGCYEVVRLNQRGAVAEGAFSNLIWLCDGQLFTPSRATGLLPGTVRGVLLGRLPIREGVFPLEHLLDAEAVFLTNSGCGVLPVDWLRTEGEERALSSRGSIHFAELEAALAAATTEGGCRL